MASFVKHTIKAEPFYRNSRGDTLVMEAADGNPPNGIMLAITSGSHTEYLELTLNDAIDATNALAEALTVTIELKKKATAE